MLDFSHPTHRACAGPFSIQPDLYAELKSTVRPAWPYAAMFADLQKHGERMAGQSLLKSIQTTSDYV